MINNYEKEIEKISEKYKRNVELLTSRVIKSYAPGISHVVLDIQVGE